MRYIFRQFSRQQERMNFEDVVFECTEMQDGEEIETVKFARVEFVAPQQVQQGALVQVQVNLNNVARTTTSFNVVAVNQGMQILGGQLRFNGIDLLLNLLFNFNGNVNQMFDQWVNFIRSLLNLGTERINLRKYEMNNQYYNSIQELHLQMKYGLAGDSQLLQGYQRDGIISYFIKAGKIQRLTSHGIIQILRVAQLLLRIIPQQQYARDIKYQQVITLYALNFLNYMRDVMSRRDNIGLKMQLLKCINDQTIFSVPTFVAGGEDQDVGDYQKRFIAKDIWNFNLFSKETSINSHRMQNIENIIELMTVDCQNIAGIDQGQKLRHGRRDEVAMQNPINESQQLLLGSIRAQYNVCKEQFAIKETIREAIMLVRNSMNAYRINAEQDELIFINLRIITKCLKWQYVCQKFGNIVNMQAGQEKMDQAVSFMAQIFSNQQLADDEINEYRTVQVNGVIENFMLQSELGIDRVTNYYHDMFYNNNLQMLEEYGVSEAEDNAEETPKYIAYCNELGIAEDEGTLNEFTGFQSRQNNINPIDIANTRAVNIKVIYRKAPGSRDQQHYVSFADFQVQQQEQQQPEQQNEEQKFQQEEEEEQQIPEEKDQVQQVMVRQRQIPENEEEEYIMSDEERREIQEQQQQQQYVRDYNQQLFNNNMIQNRILNIHNQLELEEIQGELQAELSIYARDEFEKIKQNVFSSQEFERLNANIRDAIFYQYQQLQEQVIQLIAQGEDIYSEISEYSQVDSFEEEKLLEYMIDHYNQGEIVLNKKQKVQYANELQQEIAGYDYVMAIGDQVQQYRKIQRGVVLEDQFQSLAIEHRMKNLLRVNNQKVMLIKNKLIQLLEVLFNQIEQQQIAIRRRQLNQFEVEEVRNDLKNYQMFIDSRKRMVEQNKKKQQKKIDKEQDISFGETQRKKRKQEQIPSPNVARVLYNICQFYQCNRMTDKMKKLKTCLGEVCKEVKKRINLQQCNDELMDYLQNQNKFSPEDFMDEVAKRANLLNVCKQRNKGFFIKEYLLKRYKLEVINHYPLEHFDLIDCQQIDIINMEFHVFVANKRVDEIILRKYLNYAPAIQSLSRNDSDFHRFMENKESTNEDILRFVDGVMQRFQLNLVYYQFTLEQYEQKKKADKSKKQGDEIAEEEIEEDENEKEQCNKCALFVISYDLETCENNQGQVQQIQKGGTSHWDYCCSFFIRASNRYGADEDRDNKKCDAIEWTVQKYNAKSPIVSLWQNGQSEQACEIFLRIMLDFRQEISEIAQCDCYDKDLIGKNQEELQRFAGMSEMEIKAQRIALQCYAYNGAKFDTHFMYRAARKMNLRTNLIGTSSDLKQLIVADSIQFRDAKQVCGVFGSLKNVAKSMKLKQLKDEMQIGNFIKKTDVEANIEAIKTYCVQDTLVVDDLIQTMREQYRKVATTFNKKSQIADRIFLNAMSVSGIAMKFFQFAGMKADWQIKSVSLERPNVLAAQQNSYRGGLTEALYVGHLKFDQKENVHCFDFNSLYPSIMQGIRILDNYGCQQEKKLVQEVQIKSVREYYDFYRTNINPKAAMQNFGTSILELGKDVNAEFPNLNFFPEIGDQDIYYLTKFQLRQDLRVGLIGLKIKNEGTIYPLSFDLDDYLAQHNGKEQSQKDGIAVLGFFVRNLLLSNQMISFSFKTMIYTSAFKSDKGHKEQMNSIQMFKTYIKQVYEQRLVAKKDKNASLSEVFKILMNSLYGKFGQRDFGVQRILTKEQFQSDVDFENAMFEMLCESKAIFSELKDNRSILNSQELFQLMRAHQLKGEVEIEEINSLDENIEPQYRLKFKNNKKIHTQIGSLVLIASTITAVASFLEGTLMNYCSSKTTCNKQGRCFYGDTDSVFIDECGIQIIKGELISAEFKKLTVFRINDKSMLALKQETSAFINEMYIFGRKFYAYKVNDKWTCKCKGIQSCDIEQFKQVMENGKSQSQQLRFIKKNGFVETHNRIINNVIRLKQNISKEFNDFSKLKPFLSIQEYNNTYKDKQSVIKFTKGAISMVTGEKREKIREQNKILK